MEIDNLVIEIETQSTNAIKGINDLTESIKKLNTACSTGNFTKFAQSLREIKTASNQTAEAISKALKNVTSDFLRLAKALESTKVQANQTATALSKALKSIKSFNSTSNIKDSNNPPSMVNALQTIPTSSTALVKALDDAQTSVKQTTNTFAQMPSGVNKATFSINTLVKALGGLFIVRRIINFFKEAMNEITDYQEVLGAAGIAMGSYAQEVVDYAKTVEQAVGLDSKDWIKNQTAIYTMAKGYGIASEQAQIMSKNLTQLSYDLGAFWNDREGAFDKVKSSFAGELEPIRGYGGALSKATLQEEAYALGITKSVSAMTEGEKATLRYIVLMNQMEGMQNTVVKEYDNAASAIERLKNAMTLLYRAVGSLVLPALNSILPVLIAIVNAIRKVIETIMGLFGIKYPQLNWDNSTQGVTEYASALDDATGSAKALKKQLAGFDEINNLTTPTSGSGGSDVAMPTIDWGDLPEYDFLKGLSDEVDKLQGTFDTLAQVLVIVGAGFFAFKLMTTNFTPVLTELGGVVGDIMMFTITRCQELWGLLISNPIVLVITAVTALIAWLVYLYNTNDKFKEQVNTIIQSIVNKITEFYNAHFKPIVDFIVANVSDGLSIIWQVTKATFDIIFALIQILVVGVVLAVDTILKALQPVFNWVGERFNTFIANFKDGCALIGKIIGDVASAIWRGSGETANILLGYVEGTINKIIDGINWLTAKLNRISFTVPDWLPRIGGKSWGINISQISRISLPRLAYGGVVDRATTAVIGEDGAEAVVPLHKTEWMNVVAQGITEEMDVDNTKIEELLEELIDVVANKPSGFTTKDVDNAYSYIKKQKRIMGGAY